MTTRINRFAVSVFVVVCSILAVVLFSAAQYFTNSRPKRVDLTSATILDANQYQYCFDRLEPDGDYFRIRGWCVITGSPLRTFHNRMVLYSEGLDEAWSFPLALVSRPDVTAFFDDGNNYNNSGFEATIGDFLPEGQYHLAVLVDNGEEKTILKTEETIHWDGGRND